MEQTQCWHASSGCGRDGPTPCPGRETTPSSLAVDGCKGPEPRSRFPYPRSTPGGPDERCCRPSAPAGPTSTLAETPPVRSPGDRGNDEEVITDRYNFRKCFQKISKQSKKDVGTHRGTKFNFLKPPMRSPGNGVKEGVRTDRGTKFDLWKPKRDLLVTGVKEGR